MSLLSCLKAWFRSFYQPEIVTHQYQQDEDFRILTQELVQFEQRPEEEIDYGSVIRQSRRLSPVKLISCWESLSPREQEVAALICLDYTNDEIASKLNISATTVKSHIRKIMTKFQMHSKIELSIALEEWDFRDWDRPPYR